MGRKLASFLCAGLSRKKQPTSDNAAVNGSPEQAPSAGGSHHHRFGSSMGVRAHGGEDEGLWKKTIILGEKCRVPDEAMVYDEFGDRVSTYHHRKTSTASSTGRISCSDRRGTFEPPRLEE